MNHLEFFGLAKEPFLITPDRDFFYPSRSHLVAWEVISFGLNQGEGFMVLTGEVGAGKTLLLRLLLAELPSRFETALIISPHLAPRELLLAILRDIGLEQPAATGIDQLLRLLNEHLAELARQEKRLVVIIDEAQNLPAESLEQLRLLSNFESDTCKLVQILLVGQPELRSRLQHRGLRQLWQRITVIEELQPLAQEDITHYVKFRLSQAGGGRLSFTRAALDQAWQYSRGIPRLINKLLNRSLLVAYSRQSTTVTRQIIRDAVETLAETAFLRRSRRRRRLFWFLAALGGLLLLGAAGAALVVYSPYLEQVPLFGEFFTKIGYR